MGTSEELKKGDEVYCFYRMSKRCDPRRQYVAVLDPRHGSQRPRMGLSAGWLPGRVAADPAANSEELSVELTWPHFYTERGYTFSSAEEGPWVDWFRPEDLMIASEFPKVGPSRGLAFSPGGYEPELGILAFRWGGLNHIVAPAQWGDTGSSVSDLFVDSFLDMAVVPRLHNSFEVWTVYIEDSTDLIKLADAAHLIFGPNHPLRRAKRVCGMYFLYPTAFEENCIPNIETGEDKGAAMVDQKSLFRLMKAVERTGIPTRFPHTSGLYEQLASKSWTHVLSTVPHLRVPPTVALPRMLPAENCTVAADRALTALRNVKAHQARMRGESDAEVQVTKGVAKLGFSWEALDVKFWQGKEGLEDALVALTQTIEISGELTGQPHDCTSILVQEFCEHDLELRAYAVEGKIEAIIFTKFCRIKENNEFGDFEELFTSEEAAAAWMGGDSAALADGERQCREATEHWLQWVQAQSCEMPAAIRFDYFVGRNGTGKATIWTLEICELGFSMLGEKDLPSKVFSAMMRQCLGEGPVPAGPAARTAPPRPQAASAATTNGATKGGAGQAAAPVAPGPVVDEVVAPPVGTETAGGKKGAGKKKKEAVAAPVPAKGGKKGQGGGGVPKAPTSGPAPAALSIVCPNGIQEQKKCAGKYTLDKGMAPMQRPLWKHSRGDRFIYCGTDLHWYIGDKDEYEANFDCNEGYLRLPGAEAGRLPHEGAGLWERFNTKTEEWVVDAAVVVTDVSQG